MNVAEAILEATQRLTATIDTARLDAEVLMAHCLNVSRSQMLVGMMREPAPGDFSALVARRAAHEPVAYITGKQEFFGHEFAVEPGVLIPRSDSETLVEAALELSAAPARVLDLGTGSGALLISVLAQRPGAKGVGIDASPTALRVAEGNAASLGVSGAADFRLRDWRDAGWSDDLGEFDLILCNPPYVEEDANLAPDVRDFEPALALFAGAEGFDDYRKLIPQLRSLMTPSAIALLEIGATQAHAVSELAEKAGFVVALCHDLANRPRVVILS
ncbi:MAG: peptide chain release factor N(5)-glutamine methyltransferase [Pseudomonadota bacterium]